MNNSISTLKNRTIRRQEEKIKRKIIVHLLGKGKTDKRTYKNLKAIFSYISSHPTFTGPQILKNTGLKGSILYDLLGNMLHRGLIAQTGTVRSAGRGETKVYSLTLAGKIVASYVNDNASLFREVLKEIYGKEANPLKRFCINALLENYPDHIQLQIVKDSVKRMKYAEEGLSLADFIAEVFEEAFLDMFFIRDHNDEFLEIFRKNVELLEKSEYKDFFYLFFKLQLEGIFLFQLEGDKLAKYAESLKHNLQHLHVPCYNPECTNVIVVSSMREISLPPYCEECKQKIKG